MDPMPHIWKATQHFTGGALHGIFDPAQVRGFVLFHAPVARADIQIALDEGDGIFWRDLGSLKMMTWMGVANLWGRFGKPSPPPKHRAKGDNVTSRWFAQEWVRFLPYARARLAKKLRKSAEFDMLDDHIMSYVTRAIERNYLSKYLEGKNTIPPSLVCVFIFHMASSDLRKNGRNPACRATHGALAPHEVKARNDDSVSWTERVEPLPTLLGEDPLANMADTSTMFSPDSADIDELNLDEVSRFVAEILDAKWQGVSLYDVFLAQYTDGLGIAQTAARLRANPACIQGARKEIKRRMRAKKSNFRDLGLSV